MASSLSRKLRSGVVRLTGRPRSHLNRLVSVHFPDRNSISTSFQAAPRVGLSATDARAIQLDNGAALGADTPLVAEGGRTRVDDVLLGDGCIAVSCATVEIGAGTRIAEYVLMRDQDHRVGAGSPRSSGFEASSIVIGRDCWLEVKVTVLRGSRIGNGVLIGAHSLVKGEVPADAGAVGCLARAIRQTPNRSVRLAGKVACK